MVEHSWQCAGCDYCRTGGSILSGSILFGGMCHCDKDCDCDQCSGQYSKEIDAELESLLQRLQDNPRAFHILKD